MARFVRLLAAAFFVTTVVTAPAAGQSTNSSTTRATPGVLPGTTGTTYNTPGAYQFQTTPGGTVPMGAATQDRSNLPTNPPNYNNSATRPSR